MTVTAKDAMELRKQTGVGMMACRKALEEANGDKEKAIDILRKKGAAKAASKSDRKMSEGRVAMSDKSMIMLYCETDFVAKNENFQEIVSDLLAKADNEGAEGAKKYFDSIKSELIQKIGENMEFEATTVEGSVIGKYLHTNEKVGCFVVLEGGTEEIARDVAMHATAMNPLVANIEDVPEDLIEKEKDVYKEQLINEGKPEQIIEKIIVGKVKKFCAERALIAQPFVKDPSKTVGEYLGEAKLISFVRYGI